ncbi:MAG: recombination protein RecR [Desulfobacteraceae bacterium]|nr:recombination protein RecR [Desulfobacteraceae bacterium]
MNLYPKPVLKLIQSFSKLPGIGTKTAERLTLHLLHTKKNEAETLAAAMLELRQKVQLCSECFALSEKKKCKICSDQSRDTSIICVVENPSDMIAIEKANAFSGLYHVLGGALSPIDGIGPDELRIKELILRIRQNNIQEVIIATGTNVEGESTASYIAEKLNNIKITRIASGIPIGGDLKFVDQLTMQKAIKGRYGF